MPTVYAEAETQIQAQFYDLDPMEIVWHGNYVRFFEVARCALLDKIDYNYLAMKESGYAWPIIDLHVRYMRPLSFGQTAVVTASLAEYEFRLKILYRAHDAESGERLCKGHTEQVAVDYESKKMLFASPPILAQKLGIDL